MIVVSDAAVLLSAFLYPEGPAGEILRGWLERNDFELQVTERSWSKLEEALGSSVVQRKLDVDAEQTSRWLAALGLLLPAAPSSPSGAEESEPAADDSGVSHSSDAAQSPFSSERAQLRRRSREPQTVVLTLDPVLLEPDPQGGDVVGPRTLADWVGARN